MESPTPKSRERVRFRDVSVLAIQHLRSFVFVRVRVDSVCTCAGGTSLLEAPEECPRRRGTAGLSACSADWMSETHG